MPVKKDVYEPELVERDGQVFYLSDDGEGHQIAWDKCHTWSGGCGKSLLQCRCKNGPVEPYYITRWRAEAQGKTYEKPKGAGAGALRDIDLATPVSRPKALAMADFVDDDVIATVKAASETPEDQR